MFNKNEWLKNFQKCTQDCLGTFESVVIPLKSGSE